MFWLKIWKFRRGLSRTNQAGWIQAIQMTRNTNLERNILAYIKRVITIGHFVDVPCYIDDEAIQNSTGIFFFDVAFYERNLGILQLLSAQNFNEAEPGQMNSPFFIYLKVAAREGNVDVIKVLAPLIKNPNEFSFPIDTAAIYGYLDIIKFLVPLKKYSISAPDFGRSTRIHLAIRYGHKDIVKFLAPLSKDQKDLFGKTPIWIAHEIGREDIVKILQSYNYK